MSLILMQAMSCQPDGKKNNGAIRLITLDPGHFHAALVQKTMYRKVGSFVPVYAINGFEMAIRALVL